MTRRTIFISYRRADDRYAAGRLCDHLVKAFGAGAVFKDVDAISAGDDFGAHVVNVLSQCDILLALIGPLWLDARDSRGVRRLDDPRDWVRIEIETALRGGLHVVPVLLDAPMPEENQLPEGLRDLARRHAVKVRSDPDFQGDVARLIANLRAQGLPPPTDDIRSIWAETRQTRQLDELDHFIETFDGTVEAFEARRRRAQLAEFNDIGRDAEPFEHTENWDPTEFEQCFGKSLEDFLSQCADNIDAFLDRWHPSELADEALWLRRCVHDAAACSLDMWAHDYFRNCGGKRDWSKEMPKRRFRVPAVLRQSEI